MQTDGDTSKRSVYVEGEASKRSELSSLGRATRLMNPSTLGLGTGQPKEKKVSSIFEINMPVKQEVAFKLEPFMKQPLNLYGGYIKQQVQDIQWCMEQELYKHQKVHIRDLHDETEALKSENFAQSVFIEQLRQTNERLQRENDRYKIEIADLKLQFERDVARIRREAERRIELVEEACELKIH